MSDDELNAEAIKMLDEIDRRYNSLTNKIIEKHAAKVAELTEGYKTASDQADDFCFKLTELAKAAAEYRAAVLAFDGRGDFDLKVQRVNAAAEALNALLAKIKVE